MNPSTAALTAAIGLLPFLFRQDEPGPWQPPIVVYLQALLRWLAILSGAALLFFVASVSLGDGAWTRLNINFALALGGAVLTWTALQFLLATWVRLVASSNAAIVGEGGRVKLASSTIALACGVALAGVVAVSLFLALAERPDGSRADLLADTFRGASLAGILCCAGCGLWFASMLSSDRESRFSALAQWLAEADGGWKTVDVRPLGAGASYPAWQALAWVTNGQWFWLVDDVFSLIDYRDQAARKRSVPISVNLNATQLTVWGSGFPARCLGARVRPVTAIPSTFARVCAHYGEPIDADTYAAIPRKARAALVRFDETDFAAVGLRATAAPGPTAPASAQQAERAGNLVAA